MSSQQNSQEKTLSDLGWSQKSSQDQRDSLANCREKMHFSTRYRQLHDTIASERLFMLNKAFDRSSIFDTVARAELCQKMDDVYDSLGLTGSPSGPKAIAFPMTTLEDSDKKK